MNQSGANSRAATTYDYDVDDTYGQDLHGHLRYHYDLKGNITKLKDKKNASQL